MIELNLHLRIDAFKIMVIKSVSHL